jgi:hypothetical protein
MPTRRVALGERVLPTGHPGYGSILLACVVGANGDGLDEAQEEALPHFLALANAGGLSVPRRGLRFRMQTDTEGLALSRHRLLGEDGGLVLELDVHAQHPVPQLIGAVMAAAAMAPFPRGLAFDAIKQAVDRPGATPEGVIVRELTEARGRPLRLGAVPGAVVRDEVVLDAHHLPGDGDWMGVPPERRWAMEVLGFQPGSSLDRNEVLGRFRRLVRMAHPDHGGESWGAAERIVELGEARRVLLDSHLPG